MRRREFIAGLGTAAAAACSCVARAQQPVMPTIGFLHSGSPEASPNLVAGFRKGLSEMGYGEGRNVAIEFRWAQNDNDRLPEMAADLVRRRIAVIATPNSTQAALAAKAATTTIPIVFHIPGDPVQVGLVASFNRPGGNVTGVSNMIVELTAKRLGFLHELLPTAARFAVLIDSSNPFINRESAIADLRGVASAIGLQIEVAAAGTSREIDTAFASLLQKRANALLLTNSALFGARRVQLATLAARHAVPVMYYDRIFTEAGGLMSYGPSLVDSYRQVGIYTGRILKGEKPADLPVMQPTKFEFVINLQAARTLGLTIPPGLLSIADEVIE
jgi:putative tryptophan/tyrosine transport system substrate-binding protein